MVVDAKTFENVDIATAFARRHGLSMTEALDRTELLLTKQRRHNIKVQAVEELYRRLDRQNPSKIMAHFYGRVEGTPAEMFEAVKQWFMLVINNQADKTLEDL